MNPFEQESADAWCKAIGESETFQREGCNWKTHLGLVSGAKGILLDLEGGSCRSAKLLPAEETIRQADTAFRSSEETWRALIEGRESVVSAVMGGKVQVSKGDLFALAEYASAARSLLEAARKASGSLGRA
ncbi:SCP2 sterol-binding domain-containing protein [Methylacidimicrobium tartarophylax]|uniref:Uncharacterized protein n=1 Tax=Methylacidimicrobium tartarophylax TaxID=1041768 RepID=A0A5E6MDP3_9BACT|nr:SCP2 sterol-binding domain-containing protein [Methylacidimicrobium tartarophylax]VVM07332.1 hypothetical protein MAMT_01691 [Methylacidimicrobium tartarophylax]